MHKEALRSLKHRISKAIYARLRVGAFAKDTSTLMSESPDSPVQPTRGPGRSDAWGG
jgi:hypothetical protein